MEDKIEKVSDALAAAWQDGGSVNISEDLWPASLEEAMTIQDAFHAKINEEVGAWKIAMTDPSHILGGRSGGASQTPGSVAESMPPGFYGRYYKKVVQKSPGHFRMSDFRNRPQIEAEVALRLGQDLPSRDTPYSEEEIEAAIETVVMTIDVADTRWYWDPSDWPAGLLDIYKGAADFANAGALVIGDEIPGWRDGGLAKLRVGMYYSAGASRAGCADNRALRRRRRVRRNTHNDRMSQSAVFHESIRWSKLFKTSCAERPRSPYLRAP